MPIDVSQKAGRAFHATLDQRRRSRFVEPFWAPIYGSVHEELLRALPSARPARRQGLRDDAHPTGASAGHGVFALSFGLLRKHRERPVSFSKLPLMNGMLTVLMLNSPSSC